MKFCADGDVSLFYFCFVFFPVTVLERGGGQRGGGLT